MHDGNYLLAYDPEQRAGIQHVIDVIENGGKGGLRNLCLAEFSGKHI